MNPTTIVAFAAINASRNNQEAKNLEECNLMIGLLAEKLGYRFETEKVEQRYTSIFGNPKTRIIEKLVLKPI